ncbi:MAG: cytochrome C oxidase Cbb3 [Flavobacterium sp. BFFFF1]|uniref:FixH family protein n=1 Tax=Flavobacterium sp. BFFFF1 TaxID=2015557 RepID=UPI000BC36A9B|nr:FixH family protein [Flavobacterium sp. BFFFF1]OYU81819.1 MAG: cytochrome C oxidase Cbb3 [Flavobacterium sp. BFFFF1]
MKINWGTSIVIAFALFMAFILYFVVKVQENSKYDNELVVEEYYKHDAHFDEEMTKLQNTSNLKEKPTISVGPDGIRISFPDGVSPNDISGNVSFYRPSAKKLDFTRSLRLSGQSMLVPINDLAGGRWDMTMDWRYKGGSYLTKQQVYVD